jgi:CDP-glucose 4,6-dehydratase
MENLGLVFWRGRKVFLTGHTGFKGAWLSLWLQEAGADVRDFSLEPPTQPSLFREARVADEMCSKIGDIRDLGSLRQALAEQQPEIVIHL